MKTEIELHQEVLMKKGEDRPKEILVEVRPPKVEENVSPQRPDSALDDGLCLQLEESEHETEQESMTETAMPEESAISLLQRQRQVLLEESEMLTNEISRIQKADMPLAQVSSTVEGEEEVDEEVITLDSDDSDDIMLVTAEDESIQKQQESSDEVEQEEEEKEEMLEMEEEELVDVLDEEEEEGVVHDQEEEVNVVDGEEEEVDVVVQDSGEEIDESEEEDLNVVDDSEEDVDVVEDSDQEVIDDSEEGVDVVDDSEEEVDVVDDSEEEVDVVNGNVNVVVEEESNFKEDFEVEEDEEASEEVEDEQVEVGDEVKPFQVQEQQLIPEDEPNPCENEVQEVIVCEDPQEVLSVRTTEEASIQTSSSTSGELIPSRMEAEKKRLQNLFDKAEEQIMSVVEMETEEEESQPPSDNNEPEAEYEDIPAISESTIRNSQTTSVTFESADVFESSSVVNNNQTFDVSVHRTSMKVDDIVSTVSEQCENVHLAAGDVESPNTGQPVTENTLTHITQHFETSSAVNNKDAGDGMNVKPLHDMDKLSDQGGFSSKNSSPEDLVKDKYTDDPHKFTRLSEKRITRRVRKLMSDSGIILTPERKVSVEGKGKEHKDVLDKTPVSSIVDDKQSSMSGRRLTRRSVTPQVKSLLETEKSSHNILETSQMQPASPSRGRKTFSKSSNEEQETNKLAMRTSERSRRSEIPSNLVKMTVTPSTPPRRSRAQSESIADGEINKPSTPHRSPGRPRKSEVPVTPTRRSSRLYKDVQPQSEVSIVTLLTSISSNKCTIMLLILFLFLLYFMITTKWIIVFYM